MSKLPFKWSTTAEYDYYDTIDYILANFGVIVALNFIEKVEAVIEIIRINHNLFPVIKDNLHKCIISRQSSITYKKEDGMIFISSFYANRSNHKFYFDEE